MCLSFQDAFSTKLSNRRYTEVLDYFIVSGAEKDRFVSWDIGVTTYSTVDRTSSNFACAWSSLDQNLAIENRFINFEEYWTMATNRDEANKNMLVEAGQVQDKTKEAIRRIQKQAAETETLAALTLDELHNQGLQMVRQVLSKIEWSRLLFNPPVYS